MWRWFPIRSTADFSLAPALLLIVIVLLPTALVLWLVSEATENEHLAIRQRLVEVYQAQLEQSRQRMVAQWKEKLHHIDAIASEQSSHHTFAECIGQGLADSVVVFDQQGQPAYPTTVHRPALETSTPSAEWLAAEHLEFVVQDYRGAAAAYQQIATATLDDHWAARAIQSQARSLFSAGEHAAAVELLAREIENPRLKSPHAAAGRWLLIDLMLLLAERTKTSDPPLAAKTVQTLASLLNDYSQTQLPSSQRRFAMRQLRQTFPGDATFPTLSAEDLAAEYLEHSANQTSLLDVQMAGLPDVWKVGTHSGRVLALFRTNTLTRCFQQELLSVAGVRLKVLPPNHVADNHREFLSLAVGREMPGWRISLSLSESDPFAHAADKRAGLYYWTAITTIVATGSLALVVALALQRQTRLARLKNNLVATVSHELKTPLAAMRLLVDTLRDQDPPDEQQSREYLALIAQENARLSRLIDNFLIFSRIDYEPRRFACRAVAPAEVVERATVAMRERLSQPGCRLEVGVEPGLPTIAGDVDALVVVLLNLLDNAYKYCGECKQIVLRAFLRKDHVCFTVKDNGIGISPRDRERVFDRFYQVDQRLSRTTGGCGLGLSIVRSIVKAHHGTIEIESEPGKGSIFFVSLPPSPAAAEARQ